MEGGNTQARTLLKKSINGHTFLVFKTYSIISLLIYTFYDFLQFKCNVNKHVHMRISGICLAFCGIIMYIYNVL